MHHSAPRCNNRVHTLPLCRLLGQCRRHGSTPGFTTGWHHRLSNGAKGEYERGSLFRYPHAKFCQI
ncbi:hypothetical protein ZHAWSFBX_CDS_0007 [Agrobacterium phage Alfirin]|nr:hypothetical protein ZHAWSFBX_CDS_0007 [Agrobacterium phage Alfirin]